jgi:glycosyltransferase involved in cell wall biosynthesis
VTNFFENPASADARSPEPAGGVQALSSKTSVVMGAMPLLGPLTGIGQYVRQLAIALMNEQLLADLKLMVGSRFLDHAVLGASKHFEGSGAATFAKQDLISRTTLAMRRSAQQMAAKSYLATVTHTKLAKVLAGRRLREYQDTYLYHSPNFGLPPFDGPTVATVHDLSVLKFPEFHRRQTVELCERGISDAVSRGAHIITDSRVMEAEIQKEFALPSERISAIHLAPDPRCQPRTEAECSHVLRALKLKYRSFFLSVGTIEPRKNLLRLLTAFRRGRSEGHFDWPLVVVGASGWKNDKEHEALHDLCRDGRAIYLKYVPDETLHLLYSAASALVYPSIYEGFGLPVAEALASGCPVITSSGTAMEEFAAGRAKLVNPLDEDSIMRALCDIARQPALPQPEAALYTRTWRDVAIATAQVYDQASQ